MRQQLSFYRGSGNRPDRSGQGAINTAAVTRRGAAHNRRTATVARQTYHGRDHLSRTILAMSPSQITDGEETFFAVQMPEDFAYDSTPPGLASEVPYDSETSTEPYPAGTWALISRDNMTAYPKFLSSKEKQEGFFPAPKEMTFNPQSGVGGEDRLWNAPEYRATGLTAAINGTARAQQMPDGVILHTHLGDMVGEPGSWVIREEHEGPNGFPTTAYRVLPDESFQRQFEPQPKQFDGKPSATLAPRSPNMREYRKEAPPVEATQLTEGRDVTVSWQDAPLRAEAGDWVVTDGSSEWPVNKDIFANTYESTTDGKWQKTATVMATQMDEPFEVQTMEGIAKGNAGDYLVQGTTSGEAWPIHKDDFERTYVPNRSEQERAEQKFLQYGKDKTEAQLVRTNEPGYWNVISAPEQEISQALRKQGVFRGPKSQLIETRVHADDAASRWPHLFPNGAAPDSSG